MCIRDRNISKSKFSEFDSILNITVPELLKQKQKMQESNQMLIKILSVGDCQTGKSCLIKRYCEGRFVQRYITTIGVDYGVKKLQIKNRKVAINFFDLSGDEDYALIRKDFYRNSQGVLLVFDLDNRDSFLNLAKWEKEMTENGIDLKRVMVTLVGNKADLKSRQVENGEVLKFAKSRGYEYYEASAANDKNIKEIFDSIFNRVVDNLNMLMQTSSTLLIECAL
eukprot:TRINITY_DN2201_c0_g1_i5.p1 TRINITY_DN2201_c0_g1~~TRINITY_DN2201_c0_g1_i5.p1  ORF type:complete len:224 (+),score=44.76 TRINITY_DN2201_c0_g1_i5:65-736(+)